MKFTKTITKRQKKIAYRKRLGIASFITILILINLSLLYSAFFKKSDGIISPLSINQVSAGDEVKRKITELSIDYETLATENDLNYRLILKSGAEVIFDQDKDIDQQLSSLQLILKQLKIEGKTLRRLDFRFEKPIITLQ